MQSLFACTGVIACALLYSAFFRVAVAALEKAERWHKKAGVCLTWPETEDEISILNLDQQHTACVFPDIARSRSASGSSPFVAKDILVRAFDSCVTEGICAR